MITCYQIFVKPKAFQMPKRADNAHSPLLVINARCDG